MRLDHYVVPRDGTILEVLSELLGPAYPQSFVERLISFGSVWYSRVLPKPKDTRTLTQEQLKEWEEARKPGILRWGSRTDHQTPRRVPSTDMLVYKGGYIRAHVHPKRFGAVYRVPDWRARILQVTDHYVAVDKPAGVQVPPTVGNTQESLLACVEKALGLEPNSLSPPHRLDAGTQGCVVLSCTIQFSRYFQELLTEKDNASKDQDSPEEQAGRSRRSSELNSQVDQHTQYAPLLEQHPEHHMQLQQQQEQQQQVCSTVGGADQLSEHERQQQLRLQRQQRRLQKRQHQEQRRQRRMQSSAHRNAEQHTIVGASRMLGQQQQQLQHQHEQEQQQQHHHQHQQQQQQQQQQLQPELPSVAPRVRKTYRCITARPPPRGLIQHWVLQEVRQVGCMAHTLPLFDGQPVPPEAKWCALEVTQVEKVKLSEEASECWGVDPGAAAYQSTVKLITGRTHQIRAQFAACNCPLLGDNLYEALAARWFESGVSTNTTIDGNGGSDWCRAAQKDPSQPVGLQAWQMEVLEDGPYFGPAPVIFQAGPPWWWAGNEFGD
ncbi:hypothetical protein DUNSADRAFT_6355 [Dunaliella salina]|uniref:Pseudouridine synthase RsuA/RluA-like domain-containing protein n=1 Tax=Dunaliella salina TaxID=3046 RepID=A0ABQ7GNH0_DUNSA|nr:hypothetical protein DUNSADRAFT_6355 [Dunaliella salina]|eukprot:KAF5836152.1 hypothetical protein DUNSADRAFT_6355 [Dunaliella salina]